MCFKTGDKVRITNYNDSWDGTEALVTFVPPSDSWDDGYPYRLTLLTDTPSGHKKAGAEAGRWSDKYLRPLPTKLDEIIEEKFPRRIDVFYSPTSGVAAVLDPFGKFHRVFEDGTVDTL